MSKITEALKEKFAEYQIPVDIANSFLAKYHMFERGLLPEFELCDIPTDDCFKTLQTYCSCVKDETPDDLIVHKLLQIPFSQIQATKDKLIEFVDASVIEEGYLKTEMYFVEPEFIDQLKAFLESKNLQQIDYSNWFVEALLLGKYAIDLVNGVFKLLDDKCAAKTIVSKATIWYTKGGMLVYNPVGLELEGLVKIDGKTYETEKIAPMGFKVLKDIDKSCHVNLDGLTAENDFYVMTLDKAGRIARLYDKVNDREVFTGLANEIQTFEDIPRNYENWEISDFYKKKMWVVDSDAQITPVYDGSRAGFKVVQKYLKSTITQYIWLYSHNRRIDIDNDIDWHQHQILVKAAFPLDVKSDSVTCNIQFGNINRPTTANGSFEEAKFEISAHKWVDMSESDYGVAILNDCKYGYNVEENVLKLTMLKCGIWPNPDADNGRHIFTYSILPHSGDFRQGEVVKEGYKLNQPVSFMEIGENNGKLCEEFSLVSSDKENIVIETVKKAEESEDMVVRLYDAFGGKVKTSITVADGFKEAYLCDMLENEIEKLEFNENKVNIPVSNYEVVTLKFKR